MTVFMLLAALGAAFSLWRIGRRLRFFLHMLQLEGYRAGPFSGWVAARPFDALVRRSHLLAALVLAALWTGVLEGMAGGAVALALWALAFASSARYRRDAPKKPLVWTARMKRTGILAGTFAALSLAGGAAWAAGDAPVGIRLARVLAGFGAADLLAPLWAALSVLLLEPVERRFREGFKRQARALIAARPDLHIVAVTGSYGKTSVKFAIAAVLGQRYSVLATPGSYNTPMGICTVINRDLKPWHQVLILEMGIRHPGDMDELLDIVQPDIAVVTGIGVAHLESMGSKDTIAREKGRIVERLRHPRAVVLNADDAYAEQHADRAAAPVTMVSTSANADLSATGVGFDADGTRFQVHERDSDAAVQVNVRLLGRHNVLNHLLALAVGRALGVRLRSGARGLAELQPVPHRLSPRLENGLLILDDAFNSNPIGARNALEVLGSFKSGRRFVVTPGMIELGSLEDAENEAFGAAMVGFVDVAVLVGPERTEPIRRGLIGAGFPEAGIRTVATLFEAQRVIRNEGKPGDTVLFENDLPDQYTERMPS